MNAAMILVVAVIFLLVGYFWYGRRIARFYGVSPDRETPAHTLRDDVDYVPCNRFILFGHHFASIAGGAPIIGPIIAAQFGWVPCLLWILFGCVFMGAVTDFGALIISVRHEGKSVASAIEEYIGSWGKQVFLLFCWATLLLIISVFVNIVAKTFVDVPEAASASVLFIFLAVAFGILVYRRDVNFGLASVVAVMLLFGCVFLGDRYPCSYIPFTQTAMTIAHWRIILFVYVIIASLVPVWLLLQPRDYLNSFLLYSVLLLALAGFFVARPAIRLEPLGDLVNSKGDSIFPMLFVIIACGAISGFHSLVASGTTAKQLSSEKDAQFVGYGTMLLEGLLAVIALTTVAVMTTVDYREALKNQSPLAIFANSIARANLVLGIDEQRTRVYVLLGTSAFLLTSLDTATRLARFMFEEFFVKAGARTSVNGLRRVGTNRYVSTFITVGMVALFAWSGAPQKVWQIFGAANQLLAAMSLLAISAWLVAKKSRALFVRIPMILMFLITISALAIFTAKNIPHAKKGVLKAADIKGGKQVIEKIVDGTRPIDRYLRERSTSEELQVFRQCRNDDKVSPEARALIAEMLNSVLVDRAFYSEKRFAGIEVSSRLVEQIRRGSVDTVVQSNRRLLATAYPGAIVLTQGSWLLAALGFLLELAALVLLGNLALEKIGIRSTGKLSAAEPDAA